MLLLSSAFMHGEALRSADLSKQQWSWRLIVGGSVSSTICDTSYGFAFLSDGRTICAVSKDGRFLWQRSVRGAPTPYMSHVNDILMVVTAEDTLNLINPSGQVLWSAKAGFEITENPLAGKDGRIFVRGKDAIACYSLQGKRKWLLRTSALRTDLALTSLNDGSLLAFLEATNESGKSRALRLSPFGETLETTTFSGFVHAARSCKSGVLVALSDGAGGLCAVEDGTVVSRWHTSGIGDCRQLVVFADDVTGAFLSQSGAAATATLVDVATGERLSTLALGALTLSAANQLRTTNDGVYISDGKRALEFSAGTRAPARDAAAANDNATGAAPAAATGDDATPDDGEEAAVLWEAALPAANTVASVFYTADGTLLVCRKDWIIHAYVMAQHVGDAASAPTPASAAVKTPNRSYQPKQEAKGTLYALNALERIPIAELTAMRKALSVGDYSTKEREWSAKVQLELENWLYDLMQQPQGQTEVHSYFEEDAVYARAIIDTAIAFESADFTPLLAALLARESRTPVCVDIIRAYARLGWDEDGTMLSTIENLLQQHRFTARDVTALRTICDTVYEICRYMGKPAVMARGRTILAYLLYPQFDNATRSYARKTFERIAALQMP